MRSELASCRTVSFINLYLHGLCLFTFEHYALTPLGCWMWLKVATTAGTGCLQTLLHGGQGVCPGLSMGPLLLCPE